MWNLLRNFRLPFKQEDSNYTVELYMLIYDVENNLNLRIKTEPVTAGADAGLSRHVPGRKPDIYRCTWLGFCGEIQIIFGKVQLQQKLLEHNFICPLYFSRHFILTEKLMS